MKGRFCICNGFLRIVDYKSGILINDRPRRCQTDTGWCAFHQLHIQMFFQRIYLFHDGGWRNVQSSGGFCETAAVSYCYKRIKYMVIHVWPPEIKRNLVNYPVVCVR